MIKSLQLKDKFYDVFLKEPTKENFRKFLKENCGELDEVDFKAQWIDKGSLAKTILAMANSRGGIIVVGVKETNDGQIEPVGLSEFKDKAGINNEIAKYIPAELDYVIYNYSYDSSEYKAVENKKFQLLLVNDTPERLPFISQAQTTDLTKDTIYIRRGTKCERATASEIEKLLEYRIDTIFKESSDLTLKQHLEQLRILYNELPKKINVLVRKGISPFAGIASSLATSFKPFSILSQDEYEEQDNPEYPQESYEEFINKMIKKKKLKIEKFLDLK